jgi:hypothetical protein
MSFTFHGSGTREQVIAQMRHASTNKNHAAAAARDLVVAVLEADTDAPPGAGYETRYVVKANGHSGGGVAASLNLTIEPLVVPDVDAHEAAAVPAAPGDTHTHRGF